MEKRPTSNRQAITNPCTTIVLRARNKSQENRTTELSNYLSHEKLAEVIRRRALTENLEILSEYGFDGDLGIIAIRCAEDLGRTAR